MNSSFSSCLMSFILGVAASVVVSVFAPTYARADYDLGMLSIEGYPTPLEANCNNRIKPHFSINGTSDYYVPSGKVAVHFRLRTDNHLTWIDGGSLTVTYGTGETFATGLAWPDNFSSIPLDFSATNSITLLIPAGATQASIEATVDYFPGLTDLMGNMIVDGVPNNNKLETTFNVVTPTTCTVPPPQLPQDICKIRPFLCYPQCIMPGCIFKWKWDPETCPMCGFGRYDITIVLPSDYRIVVYAKDNLEVARSAVMAKPERVGNKTFNQRLTFEYKQGESYTFTIMTLKGKLGALKIKPELRIRKMEQSGVKVNEIPVPRQNVQLNNVPGRNPTVPSWPDNLQKGRVK